MLKNGDKYCQFYKDYTEFVSSNYHYHNLKPDSSIAMRSHLNYFKLLFERNLQLLRPNGFLNILVPSSYQTDEGSYGLRILSLMENKLLELYSFENRGFFEKSTDTIKTKLFPDVHPQFKFSIVFVKKEKPGQDDFFNSMFYLTNPAELYSNDPLPFNLEMVKRFSPDNLSILEFRNERDYLLCKKIRFDHLTLRESGFVLKREFNVTDDRTLFKTERNNNIVVFEGENDSSI